MFSKTIKGTVGVMPGSPAVLNDFMWSMVQFVQYNQEYLCQPNEIIHYVQPTNTFHAFARNYLCEHAYGDWIFMLDTDHAFEPDILARMLRVMYKYNTPVLTGLYQYKQEPFAPVLFVHNDDKDTKDINPFELLGDWDRKLEIMQIASSGGGCLLIQKWVLKEIREQLKEEPFDISFPHSEDHSFYKRLIKLGIPAFCAPNIECHHIMPKKLSLKDYNDPDMQFFKRKISSIGA